MRIGWCSLLVPLLIFLSSASNAKVRSVQSQSLQKMLLVSDQYSIAKVSTVPSNVAVGDEVSFAIELSTDFEGTTQLEPIVTVQMAGTSLKAFHRGGRLWTTEKRTVIEEGDNTIALQLFVQDQVQSEHIQQQLILTKAEIDNLTRQISVEIDTAKKNYLINQKNQKILFRNDLEASLENLKRPVASKTHSFKASEGQPPGNFPQLTSCQPAYGALAGVSLTLQGVNLEGATKVLIGGVEVSNAVISAGSIQFSTPTLTEGLKDIVVQSIVSGQTVSVTLKNAFFALDAQMTGPIGDVYPVAFAGQPKKTASQEAVVLDGSLSYSSDGAALSYQWAVVSKPIGALPGDGVLTNETSASPSFLAATSGNYVLSLVVSNGVKESTPSLTVVTVGPQYPVTISPSNIYGVVSKDGVYVGGFSVCNNLQQEVRYQLFNTAKIVLISGFKRGTIPANNCQTFQFSVENHSQSALSFDLPFVTSTPSFTKNIHVDIAPATAEGLSLLTSFPSSQWTGETDLEALSINSYVPLFGTYDEVSSTKIILKNDTENSIEILNPPTIVHLSGSSNVFSANFPVAGITVPAFDEVEFELLVSPGVFGSNNIAEALLEWEIGGVPRVLLMQTYKLPTPISLNKSVDFGSIEEGGYFGYRSLRIPNDFLTINKGLLQVESFLITDDENGLFDFSTWNGPVMIGDIDLFKSDVVEVSSYLDASAIGVYEGAVQVKIKGYQVPFNYNLLGEVQAVTP